MRKKNEEFRFLSAKQMQEFAASLAEEIKKSESLKLKTALVLALSGNLGSGKTIFAQGFLRALGVQEKITSPTFILMQRFPLSVGGRQSVGGFTNAWHIDCYRAEKKDFLKLGIKKILRDKKNILVIEWAEKIAKLLPPDSFTLHFRHGKKSSERFVRMTV